MVEHGQATIEGIGITAVVAILLAALAVGLGPSAGPLGSAVAGALDRALAGPADAHVDDGLTDAERQLAAIVQHGGGDGDAPDVADLADALDARLGPVLGALTLARAIRTIVAAEPAHPCVVPGIYGSRQIFSPVAGTSPTIRVTDRAEQDRWVSDALAENPLAELAMGAAGLVPVFTPAVAFADIADALPEEAPADGVEPGHRAGDIVIEQPVAGDANAARKTVRVRVLRSSGGDALRIVRDALVQHIYPRWTHPCL